MKHFKSAYWVCTAATGVISLILGTAAVTQKKLPGWALLLLIAAELALFPVMIFSLAENIRVYLADRAARKATEEELAWDEIEELEKELAAFRNSMTEDEALV